MENIMDNSDYIEYVARLIIAFFKKYFPNPWLLNFPYIQEVKLNISL